MPVSEQKTPEELLYPSVYWQHRAEAAESRAERAERQAEVLAGFLSAAAAHGREGILPHLDVVETWRAAAAAYREELC